MRIDRRTALLGAGAAAAASGAAGTVWAQAGVRRRKGASTLTANSDDVVAFRDGVRLMKRRRDSLSWSRQNDIHGRSAQHNNGLFLPWHRLQLWHLEQIIARLTGHAGFSLPYWDWQSDRHLPSWVTDSASPLFERNRGRDANTKDYAEARWARSPYTADLTRDTFEMFCGRMPEGAGTVESYGHNLIHELVGGLMGRVRTAAADPVFWLHHCNVDRVWATWHARQPKSVYPTAWTERTVDGYIGADGRPTGTWRVARTLDTRALGYQYDNPYPTQFFSVPEIGPAGATRRIPTGGSTWRLRAEGQGGGRLTLAVPAEIVERLRAADDTLMIQGVGSVAYAREEALLDRSLEIGMRSGSKHASLGSSPTFVHLAEPGTHHDHRGDYIVPYRFGEEVLNLLADDDGLTIEVDAEDLVPDQRRGPARATALTLDLTLTESRWA